MKGGVWEVWPISSCREHIIFLRGPLHGANICQIFLYCQKIFVISFKSYIELESPISFISFPPASLNCKLISGFLQGVTHSALGMLFQSCLFVFPSIFEQMFTSHNWIYQIWIKIEQKITVLHIKGGWGVLRDPQKWLRNLWMTPIKVGIDCPN